MRFFFISDVILTKNYWGKYTFSEFFCDQFMQKAKGTTKLSQKLIIHSCLSHTLGQCDMWFKKLSCFASSNRNLTYSAGFCARNCF